MHTGSGGPEHGGSVSGTPPSPLPSPHCCLRGSLRVRPCWVPPHPHAARLAARPAQEPGVREDTVLGPTPGCSRGLPSWGPPGDRKGLCPQTGKAWTGDSVSLRCSPGGDTGAGAQGSYPDDPELSTDGDPGQLGSNLRLPVSQRPKGSPSTWNSRVRAQGP